ncbi:lipocalin-like domain-containing protein [Marinobacterium arenosum]|uniref:lipocalin-like domain-containing protein n=1 Tax=Marinobacterium arenosum TaxID=2862496 RepID=UPI001C9524E1|nr:lipocalin-like domain-containing protein [Marinobacterium arenosum]MBY4678697.1 hypothetical protein [Marinobacterium arenosum]
MKGKHVVLLLLVAVMLMLVTLLAQTESDHPRSRAQSGIQTESMPLSEVLADTDTTASFQQARSGELLSFPADHLAHPGFRSEWWYLTGNLQQVANDSQRYGFQFTLFRQAQAAEQQVGNPWLEPQLYMAHMALALIDEQTHLVAQRLSRAGPGLAGSAAQPLALWLESWRLQAERPQTLFPAQLEAWDPEQQFGYRLQLVPMKPKVLQGEDGYSAKRHEAGHGSHYYSYTRLSVSGELQLAGRTIPVTGLAWYDHEWASSPLADYQSGWDWFALQLEDGRELVLFRLRSHSTEYADFQYAALIGAEGEKRLLAPAQLSLRETRYWQSPSGSRYPAGWQLEIPEQDISLKVQPRFADQEMRLAFRYWEGAVLVSGSHPGQGYVELTGY